MVSQFEYLDYLPWEGLKHINLNFELKGRDEY